MFTIKTSKENKERVTQLTKRLNLGAENTIARLAFAYSIANNKKLNLSGLADAQGKEYNSKVLFGDFYDIYTAVVCVQYELYKTDKDLPKYIKLHLDDGLFNIFNELSKNDSINGLEFIINEIEQGIKAI